MDNQHGMLWSRTSLWSASCVSWQHDTAHSCCWGPAIDWYLLQTTHATAAVDRRNTHLTALCPGLPRWAGTRKVRPIWILRKQETCEWQWHQLGHMQVCTSLQTDNHASTPPLSFYRSDALPAAQPTASKHWRHDRWNRQTNGRTDEETLYHYTDIAQ